MAEPKSRSRAGGHFYLANEAEERDPANGPVHNIAQIIRNVMTSPADAEIGALLVNSRFAICWVNRLIILQSWCVTRELDYG